MKIYNFKFRDYNTVENKQLYFPDDVKFCKVYNLSTTQNYYCIIEPYDDTRYILFANCVGKSHVNRYGNLLCCSLNNCYCEQDLPLVSLEDINKEYKSEIQRYSIVAKITNQEYNYISQKIISLSIYDTTKPIIDHTDEIINLRRSIQNMPHEYVGSIHKILKFSGSEQGLCVNVQSLYIDSLTYKIDKRFPLWQTANPYCKMELTDDQKYKDMFNEELLKILNYESE